jgi:lipoprotein-releasing system ATP-binding protein
MSQAVQSPITTAPAAGKPILRARGVRKTFKMGDSVIEVLKQIDLTLQPGEFVAIEGRSGSGKSTLLHILAGLDSADAGIVDFDGSDIAPLAAEASRALARSRLPGAELLRLLMLWANTADRRLADIRNTQFGFVFQFYHLLPELNVLENTMLAPMIQHSWLGFRSRSAELRERATSILNDMGLGHRLKHRPNQLSGGERQRVAIARALMNKPKIVFADEPTGNLDAETGRQIMGVLEKLHRENGQTIVMVTHDRALARTADRVLVLKDGRMEKPVT